MPPPEKNNAEDKRFFLSAVVREPFVHFVLIGTVIFLGLQHMQSRRYVIDAASEEIQRIAATYQKQYGSAPAPAQMQTLVDAYIVQEVYLREGMFRGTSMAQHRSGRHGSQRPRSANRRPGGDHHRRASAGALQGWR